MTTWLIRLTAELFANRSQEYSLYFSPRFLNLKETQLWFSQSEIVFLSNAYKYWKLVERKKKKKRHRTFLRVAGEFMTKEIRKLVE